MLLDDAYLPGVAAIVDYVKGSDAWALEPPISFRTACIRKLQKTSHRGMQTRRRPRQDGFSYLPPGRRVVAPLGHAVFSTRAGIWVVRKLRGPQ